METEKKKLLEQSGFKCKKCGYYSPVGNGLELNREFKEILCSVCNTFAPIKKEEFDNYLGEKIGWQVLETFRRFGMNRASHQPHKSGMIIKAKQGKLVARPPFGYNVVKGNLVPNNDAENVRLIFKEFVSGKSLNQIAKSYGLSVNGIKKILKNFSYLGKIRFDNQVSQGTHTSLLSPELFNEAQKIFDEKNKSKKKPQISSEVNNG
jgi:hypothetical protein